MLELKGPELEPFQDRAWDALVSDAPDVLIYGGSGSGKTQLVMTWLVMRACANGRATHTILRHHFTDIRNSIINDTLPDVCERLWPGRRIYELNRTEWYAEFESGGRIYFGGLDDKERTDKILGQSHSTMYLNETSQISYASYLKASTRLRQTRGLKLKMVCDMNPTTIGHWTERLWIKHVDPSSGKKLKRPENYAFVKMNPCDNPHLPDEYVERLQNLPDRDRVRFWLGDFSQGTDGPLWTYESIEAARVDEVPPGVSLERVLVSVDPSGCHGPDDKRSDEIGICVVGLGDDGIVYVLEDASGRFGPSGPEGWGALVIRLYTKWNADAVIGETNYGGAMVGAVIQTADADGVEGINVPFREVTASRGKAVRAEPVANLCNRGKTKFVGVGFPFLEQQLLNFSTAGYMGEKSPDRADAFVWGVTALGVIRMSNQGLVTYYEQGNAAAAAPVLPVESTDDDLVELVVPPHFSGSSSFSSIEGSQYFVTDGRIRVKSGEVEGLKQVGFVPA